MNVKLIMPHDPATNLSNEWNISLKLVCHFSPYSIILGMDQSIWTFLLGSQYTYDMIREEVQISPLLNVHKLIFEFTLLGRMILSGLYYWEFSRSAPPLTLVPLQAVLSIEPRSSRHHWPCHDGLMTSVILMSSFDQCQVFLTVLFLGGGGCSCSASIPTLAMLLSLLWKGPARRKFYPCGSSWLSLSCHAFHYSGLSLYTIPCWEGRDSFPAWLGCSDITSGWSGATSV